MQQTRAPKLKAMQGAVTPYHPPGMALVTKSLQQAPAAARRARHDQNS